MTENYTLRWHRRAGMYFASSAHEVYRISPLGTNHGLGWRLASRPEPTGEFVTIDDYGSLPVAKRAAQRREG